MLGFKLRVRLLKKVCKRVLIVLLATSLSQIHIFHSARAYGQNTSQSVSILNSNHSPQLGEGISLFVPIRFQDKMGTNITLDAGHIAIEQLPQALEVFTDDKGKTLLPQGESVSVVILVPKGISQEYKENFKQVIMYQLAGSLKTSELKVEIKEAYIDIEKTKKQILENMSFLDALSQKQDDKEVLNLVDKALELSQTRLEQLDDFKKNWWKNPIEWLNDRNPFGLSVARTIISNSKGILTAGLWISRVGLNLWGVSIAAINYAIIWMFSYFGPEWSLWTSRHKFPFSQKLKWLDQNKLVKRYNSAFMFKSTFVSFLRSVGVSYFMRYLAFQSGTTSRHPWSTEFFQGLLGISSMEILSDASMNVGLRRLMKKGYVNFQALSYLYWGRTFIDTVMHFLFRSGLPLEAYAVGATSWSISGMVFLLSKTLHPKEKKFVLISDAISKELVTFGKKQGFALHTKKRKIINQSDYISVIQSEGLIEAVKVYSAQDLQDLLQTLNIQSNDCNQLFK